MSAARLPEAQTPYEPFPPPGYSRRGKKFLAVAANFDADASRLISSRWRLGAILQRYALKRAVQHRRNAR